jgi:hypothetical protein
MPSEYQITHLLSYSPKNKDSLDVESAVDSIMNWENAMVGSIEDLVDTLRGLAWDHDEICSTLNLAFTNLPLELDQIRLIMETCNEK